jgi:nicotinic acid mononucleotide adenylyltransferase
MLFPKNMKFYIYPMLDEKTGELRHSDSLELSPEIKCLYDYLKTTRKFIDIRIAKKEWLNISSAEVLRLMQEGSPRWETMVPKHVIEIVKQRCLFDFKCEL